MRVLTYNIHKCIGGVDRRYQPERIAETIAHYSPDIVLLQEVDTAARRSRWHHQVDVLGEVLGLSHRAFFANVALWSGGAYGNAILSRFPLSDAQNIDLTVPTRKRRSVLHARCRVPVGHASTRTLHVYNMHLGLSGIERRLQLRRFLSSHPFARLDPQRSAVLLGGDLNDVWGTLGPKLLAPAGFRNDGMTIAPTFPAYAPGFENRWGTAAYDPDRHQFLLWSGGHASSWENEVDHFSVRGSVWTISYPPDACINPTETLSTWAGYGGVKTFFDRVVPGHSYHYVAYDSSGRYFYRSAVYDVRAREWRKPLPGFLGTGEFLISTPHGVVSLSTTGNCRFDAKAERWEKLPWEGPAIRQFGCDQSAVAYDSRRDCLWAFNTEVIKYDFKTGKAEQVKTECQPKVKPWFLVRESVCIPDADLVLSPVTVKAKDGWTGWLAWDLTAHKYLAVDLPRNAGGKPGQFELAGKSQHMALAYDAELNVVLLNDMPNKAVWALRLDRKTAKIADAE